MLEEIEITIEDGVYSVNWWTPDSGDLICDLCGKCEGWRTVGFSATGETNTCPNANPYCG